MSAGTKLWLGATTQQLIQTKAGYRRRKVSNVVMLTTTGFLMLLALVPLFWIIGYVIYKGGQYINLDFLSTCIAPSEWWGEVC